MARLYGRRGAQAMQSPRRVERQMQKVYLISTKSRFSCLASSRTNQVFPTCRAPINSIGRRSLRCNQPLRSMDNLTKHVWKIADFLLKSNVLLTQLAGKLTSTPPPTPPPPDDGFLLATFLLITLSVIFSLEALFNHNPVTKRPLIFTASGLLRTLAAMRAPCPVKA